MKIFMAFLVDWFSSWLHSSISRKVEAVCAPVYCSWGKLRWERGPSFMAEPDRKVDKLPPHTKKYLGEKTRRYFIFPCMML